MLKRSTMKCWGGGGGGAGGSSGATKRNLWSALLITVCMGSLWSQMTRESLFNPFGFFISLVGYIIRDETIKQCTLSPGALSSVT